MLGLAVDSGCPHNGIAERAFSTVRCITEVWPMYKKVRKNYMKLLLPVAAALLAACVILLGITRFGIRYAFVTSLPVEGIPADELN